eukprot:14600564-Ditylum_brightwellii.AAC.1
MSSTGSFETAAAILAGTGYLFYQLTPMIMTTLIKLQLNPINKDLGQVIAKKDALSYVEIASLGIVKGKSALIIGGTRGVRYGMAIALAKSGASRVTIVG